VVTICTASLTFNNSTSCPHSVFMCFVWIWEQTAIISLYNINRDVFITEANCVYCAVRTELLKLIVYSPRSSEFDPGPVRVTCTVYKLALGVPFPKNFAFRQCEYSIIAPHPTWSQYHVIGQTGPPSLPSFLECSAASLIRKHRIKNWFDVSSEYFFSKNCRIVERQ